MPRSTSGGRAGKTHYSDQAPAGGKKPENGRGQDFRLRARPALLARAAATAAPTRPFRQGGQLERQLHAERLARASNRPSLPPSRRRRSRSMSAGFGAARGLRQWHYRTWGRLRWSRSAPPSRPRPHFIHRAEAARARGIMPGTFNGSERDHRWKLRRSRHHPGTSTPERDHRRKLHLALGATRTRAASRFRSPLHVPISWTARRIADVGGPAAAFRQRDGHLGAKKRSRARAPGKTVCETEQHERFCA